MTQFKITPAVDAAREFLEISADFTNPLELVREAISNSLDANATEIILGFHTRKEQGLRVLHIIASDNGAGMDRAELQAFFDLGNSTKRNNPNAIGEKGHGTKVFFNCQSIEVETVKDGARLLARMVQPYASLHEGELPIADVQESEADDQPNGTRVVIKGFNNNNGDKFTHERIKDYIKWFTKFGSIELEFGHERYAACTVRLKGLDAEEFETLRFGHHFPENSPRIEKLFDEFLVSAPDFYCKKIKRSGQLKRYPDVKYDAIFCIEGNKVKQSYNGMLRRPGYTPPAGGYTVQERYGLWVCKDFIPIERKNEWISTKGTEFTRLHAFINCQDFSLTANRGSVANTQSEIIEDVHEAVRAIYDDLITGDDWREIEWLESEVDAYRTLDKESKDFRWRQARANAANVAKLEGITLVEPTRESGVYALLVQLCVIRPDLFPFELVDYDTHSGIDVIVKHRDNVPVIGSALYYVELKSVLKNQMNHSFVNIFSIVCWDTTVKNGEKMTDLAGEERTMQVIAPEKDEPYTGYFLAKDRKQSIQVFVLKDYLKEVLGLEFRPRTKDNVVQAFAPVRAAT